ncbi:isomerase [Kitasatospora sp. NBC_00315]|uniref:isomerase n=1 Tax=Kitasatospora sp. NBC_00315 TaxID=2975963 RepID=UPI003248573F
MPQISVDYSAGLAEALDRQALGLALNRLAVKHLGAGPDACRTRFRAADATVVVGERAQEHELVLVAFHIFPGRTAQAKAELADAALALLTELSAPAAGRPVHAAVDVVEIDRDSYRGATLGG